MALERKAIFAWRKSGWCALVTVTLATSCTSSSSQCNVVCPPGTTVDETGCGCTQSGPVCDGGGPMEVQDGGPLLGNCCPSIALKSTGRRAPTGACSGSQPCFVAVFQICPASPSPSAGAPPDEYVCT